MNGKRGRKHSAFIVLLRLEKVCKIFMRIVPEKSNDNHFEVIEQWAWLCLIGNILKLPRSFGETLKRKKHTRELSAFAKVTAHTSEEQASSAFDQNKLWPNCEKLSRTCRQHSPQQQNPQPQQFQQPESHQSSLNNRSQSVCDQARQWSDSGPKTIVSISLFIGFKSSVTVTQSKFKMTGESDWWIHVCVT